jgi:hypothetical protein
VRLIAYLYKCSSNRSSRLKRVSCRQDLSEQPIDKSFSSSAKGTMMWRKLGPCGVVFSAFRLHLQGRDFAVAPVRTIENDVTTQKEMLGYFGEPARKGLENGYETWTYSYQSCEFGQLRDFKELYVL